MSSRSLLVVLLVLACLQSFTTATNGGDQGPEKCCFSYQTHKIPIRRITAYQEADPRCAKPAVIFTLKSGREACADPDVQWVKNIMNTTDQRLSKSVIQPESSV